jgi:hypothetical protein
MTFPSYIHSVVPSSDTTAWPVQGQGVNECGCTVAANALNLISGRQRYTKDEFVRQAGLFFQRRLGGSISPVTGWLIKQHGFGTHFGNLSRTDADTVLRDLVDRGVPVVVEIGTTRVGPLEIYGQHSILLVGYSEQYTDSGGTGREEYYFVDSEWPELGKFDLAANDVVMNGVRTALPGNRTISREEFSRMYEQKIYFPVFRTQAEHDAWYYKHIRVETGKPLLGSLRSSWITGSYDIWVGPRRSK